MRRLRVHHETVYSYRQPVGFGEHRLMFRPRDSHDIRLLDAQLTISPPAEVRWLHDVFSNSIAIATFSERHQELKFVSEILIAHYGVTELSFPLEPYAQTYPFTYPPEEAPDLVRTIERHYPDPERKVDTWAKRFLQRSGGSTVDTSWLLGEITRAVHDEFAYERRYDIGTRDPVTTLNMASGSCRDLALFMMEAVRALGFAARFVSGYLYDPSLDNGPSGGDAVQGAGDTHAWVQVYLPGAGWVEFDPTNGLVGGDNLIRVAVARDPAQANPLQGTYFGAAADFQDMSVDVRVTLEGDAGPQADSNAAAAGA